jgi:DTW domain-containing protein
MEGPSSSRAVCWRCRRPQRVCWCGSLRPVESSTRVVFVQHPKEAKVPISTCRMAHLSLPNSELHVELSAVGNPRLERLCAQQDVAVLFPSAGATDIEAVLTPPRTLVVVDGTWSNAKKLVDRCPLLSALPRVSLSPRHPGTYRIRREPAEHCLSTIEAVTYVLERLERAPGRFTPLLQVFDAMVERQLEFAQSNRHHSRHRFSLGRTRGAVALDAQPRSDESAERAGTRIDIGPRRPLEGRVRSDAHRPPSEEWDT